VFRLRSHAVDVALVLLAALVIVTSFGSDLEHIRYGSALMAVALAVLLRRSWHAPAASLAGFAVIAAGSRMTPQITGPMFLAILASFAVAGTLERRPAVAAWVAGCAAMIVAMAGNPYVEGAGDIALSLTFCTVIWAAGLAATEWSRQAGAARVSAQLVAAARDQDVAEATAHERARIAGELHDIVSHGLSIVILQTVAARMGLRDATDPVPRTDRRLEVVESTARDALDDMRRLLDLLRSTEITTVSDGVTPSVGLDQVPTLVGQARRAGLDVEASIERCGQALSPGLEAAAYRIVQEAITNVVKHAPGASASVRVRCDPDLLQISVDSCGGVAGTALAQDQGASGYGLIGMRERAELYGGRFEATPVPDGFRVSAQFPLRESP
jgi:signal transduction histidine kinase